MASSSNAKLNSLASRRLLNQRSPRVSGATPSSSMPVDPITPDRRTRISIVHSPLDTPSRSATFAFDWDAAKGLKPPPYDSPASQKARRSQKSMGLRDGETTLVRKGYVKKKSLYQRFISIPARIQFEISMFPSNVPTPSPATAACLSGIVLHSVNLLLTISRRSPVDAETDWDTIVRETDYGRAEWLHWSSLAIFGLWASSVLNVLFLLSRTRVYRLNKHPQPLSTPSAYFPESTPAFRFSSLLWRTLSLLSLADSHSGPHIEDATVQELSVWVPAEAEFSKKLFTYYSPAHALIWMGITSRNWPWALLLMAVLGAQSHVLVRSYEVLIKDREIIAAEVMAEYDQSAHRQTVKRDASTMTNEAETVDIWR